MPIRFDGLYERLLLLTWFFSLTEIALHMPMISFLTPYKVFLGLLGLLILLRMFLQGKPFIRDFFGSLREGIRPARLALLPVSLYIAFDLVSLLWTRDVPFALSKYVTIISMLSILVATVYYLRRVSPEVSVTRKIQRILLAIGLAGIATSLYTYGYLLLHDGMTYYARRLSMIEDYNQFSAVVLFSLLVMLLFLHRIREKGMRWMVVFSATLVLTVPVVWLSGSRRSFYLMLACLFVVLVLELIVFLRTLDGHSRLPVFAGTLIVSALLILGISQLYTACTTRQYNELVEDNQDIIEVIGARPVEEILTDEHALSKRETIWSIALQGFRDFSLREKLLGGGASYHADLYDTPENKPVIERLYWRKLPDQYMNPHNFLLVDLLGGGVIKTAFTLLTLLGTLAVLIRILHRRWSQLVYLLLLSVVALGNIFISSKYGLLNDKFVWTVLIFLTLFAAESREFRLYR